MSRTDASITVYCDRCGAEEQIFLTAVARNSYDMRYVNEDLERMRWRVSNNEDICDQCVYEEEVENQDDA